MAIVSAGRQPTVTAASRNALDRVASGDVGWRNAQTHLDPDTGAPQLDDLLWLNAVLPYVLEANILMDVGIGKDTRYCLAHGYVWNDPIPALGG
jgi:hypothetical protein